jgi:spore maturation protein CgeB
VVFVKILVVGDGHSAIHEVAVVAAFKKLGHEVEPFYWYPYFKSDSLFVRLWKKAQNKFLIGPTINLLNRDLVMQAVKLQPRLIFVYRGTHITPNTLIKLKQALTYCEIFGYNNDDPFAAGHPPWLWRHFLKCVPIYDLVFAYRKHNLDDFIKAGAKRVELLRSWFVPELNHPVSLSAQDKSSYECDVVFIGHYENDGRIEYLEEIVKAGYRLRIFGPPYEWDELLLKSKTLKCLAPVHLVWNADYSRAICGAKIALCFFSKLNRDTYTRRCFEIPASGTMLLSEYSDDIASLYVAGKEADFFKSKQEMISKVKFYLGDDNLRRHVALAGQQRVIQDGHDIVSRMARVIQQVDGKN